MKNLFKVGIVACLMAAFTFSGCSKDEEETYTVYTDSEFYSEFKADAGDILDDGEYINVELTTKEWNDMIDDVDNPSEYKHNWTEDQINNWLVGRGFDKPTATKVTSWLITVKHGMVFVRDGSMIYFIIK